MAVAAYDSDLTSANGGELTIANDAANWDESSDGAWDDAELPEDEVNFYIQGVECISSQFTKTGVGTIINIQGAAFTVDTDGAILIWSFWASPASLTTYANGGVRTIVGNSLGDFYAYKASGSDFSPNPIGGWANYAIAPASATIDTTVGAPTGTWTHAGIAINATAQSRGNPHAVDAIRVGRCTLEITAGQAGDYGTFTGMSAFDTSTNQRYALFQKVFGGYKWQGLMSFGLAATVVDFRDSNANIFVANTPQVSSAFNRIEINNAGSNVEWTSISISAQDGVNDTIAATASRGNFEVVANATVTFSTCTFTDMGTFIFLSGTNVNSISGTTFRRCDKVTQGGGVISNCTFAESIATVALAVADAVNSVTDTSFASSGTGYAIEGFSTATSYNLVGLTYSGYAATDGVTGNEAIHVLATTGTVTLNISGGGDTPTIHTAGATVTIVSGAVTLTVTASEADGTAIQNARVMLKASDGTGDFPFEDIVTIVNSGTTATVTHTTHGMASNDYTAIDRASLAANNGIFQITVTDANTYTYTMSSTPGASPTGTIISTFVALYGLTDVNGQVTTNRVYSTIQPVIGWTRKSTSSPFFKEGILTGSVSTTTGYISTAVMTSDE